MSDPARKSLDTLVGRVMDKVMVAAGLLSECPLCGLIWDPDEETHYTTERPMASGVQCIRVKLPSR